MLITGGCRPGQRPRKLEYCFTREKEIVFAQQFVEMTVFLCLICFSIYDKMQGFLEKRYGFFIFSIYFFFFFFPRFMQKFKMATKSGMKMIFGKSRQFGPVDSADNLRVKNFMEIAPSRSISEINGFLRFT